MVDRRSEYNHESFRLLLAPGDIPEGRASIIQSLSKYSVAGMMTQSCMTALAVVSEQAEAREAHTWLPPLLARHSSGLLSAEGQEERPDVGAQLHVGDARASKI